MTLLFLISLLRYPAAPSQQTCTQPHRRLVAGMSVWLWGYEVAYTKTVTFLSSSSTTNAATQLIRCGISSDPGSVHYFSSYSATSLSCLLLAVAVYTHSHTLTTPCTCCHDVINGSQELTICSRANSLILFLAALSCCALCLSVYPLYPLHSTAAH